MPLVLAAFFAPFMLSSKAAEAVLFCTVVMVNPIHLVDFLLGADYRAVN